MSARDDWKKIERDVNRVMDRAWEDTGRYFRSITPIDGGNARRRTQHNERQIKANYAYADRLDNGWSKQAPRGMSKPSLEYYEEQIERNLRNL